MTYQYPSLPYDDNALEPYISRETLEYHHGKHHKAYVDKLNALVAGTDDEKKTLEQLICTADAGVFNNAAQVWNHTFYWNCLSPHGGGKPAGELLRKIEAQFDSFSEFKMAFTQAAATQFGSGWAWLVLNSDGQLQIKQTSNADNPLRDGDKPLLTCDVWEHAYYVDYRNARPKYIENFWHLVNWDFVAHNLSDEL